MREATSVLVVANETLVGDELVASLRNRAEHGPVRVAVVAPVNPPRRATSSTATHGGPLPAAGSTGFSRGCGSRVSPRTEPSTTTIRSRP